MHYFNLSASATVKFQQYKMLKTWHEKYMVKMLTSAKKTALLKSCMKEDVSSQGETKRYHVAYVKPDL